MMPNWSSIEAGFLRQKRQMQLGELAACLVRIKAWSLTDKNVVPVILTQVAGYQMMGAFHLSCAIAHDKLTVAHSATVTSAELKV